MCPYGQLYTCCDICLQDLDVFLNLDSLVSLKTTTLLVETRWYTYLGQNYCIIKAYLPILKCCHVRWVICRIKDLFTHLNPVQYFIRCQKKKNRGGIFPLFNSAFWDHDTPIFWV